MRRFALAMVVSAVLAPTGRAQAPGRPACEVLLADGQVVPADAVHGGGGEPWRLTVGDRAREVPARGVLSVHGCGVARNQLPEVVLAGGDVLRGLLVGGDAAGNQVEVQSAVLGRLRLPVDRLDCVLVRQDLARPADLVLPDGADEALFVKAKLGLDRIAGTVHQFGEPGIRFQPEGQPEPRWYSVRDLVGLRLRGGVARAQPVTAELCTRGGDRVGLASYRFTGTALEGKLEGGVACTVPLADVACLSLLDTGAIFVSALTPVAVAEAAHDGFALMPWQKDRAADGGPLMAGGRCYGRGLGVHSRSRLVYQVPDGAATFAVRVAFDDAAVALPVRGEVDVFVRLDDATPFVKKGLRAGEPPVTIGPLPVRPGQQLALEVDFGGGRDLGDRIDWLMPVFLPAAR